MSRLSAISIKQPWIDLILRGHKSMELRGWNVHHRGRIALHAPAKIDYFAASFFGYSEPWKLPRGKVLAIAEMDEVVLLDERNFNDYLTAHLQVIPANGPVFGIPLNQVQLLKNPVLTKGRLNIFPLDDEISKRILLQL
jgi:ASCH domain-containing protein